MGANNTRYDAATRAGRPNPLHDYTRINGGYMPTVGSLSSPLYENQSNAFEKIHIEVCNTTSGDLTFSVYIVPAGGVLANQWLRFNSAPLGANETLVFPKPYTLDSGDKVVVTASAANAITAYADLELCR